MVESIGLNRVGGQGGGGFNDETLEKGVRSVLVVVDRGEEDYMFRRGGGVGRGGGTSMMITP